MTPISSEPFSGFPPEGEIFPITGVDLAVLAGEHPFHIAERAAAEANWNEEIAANPAYFNGQMVFFNRLSLDGDVIRGVGHMVPFSTFLWWRKGHEERGGYHLFAWAVLVSSDNALIAIRMSPHTANPGMVYCAAGSLDGYDVVDGHCDLMDNMTREVREETGLDLTSATPDPQFFAMHNNRRVTVFRFFRFQQSADEMLAHISAHMLVDEEKEIDAAVAIRSADPSAQPYSPLMLPVLDMFFHGSASQS